MDKQLQHIEELIAEALSAGITLYEKNGGLAFKQTQGFPEHLKAKIVESKGLLIDYFQQQNFNQHQAGNEADIVISKAATDRSAPLSYAQEGLWFIEQLQGSHQYYMPAEFILQGKVDHQILANVVRLIIVRHEVLRTQFITDNHSGKPVQKVRDEFETPFKWLDISGITAAQRAEFIAQKVSEFHDQPFDLESDLLLRVLLIGCGDYYHLAFNMHHIVSDGASMAILLREFHTFYQVLSGEQGMEMPAPLEIQYRDFSSWQRQHLTRDYLQPHLSYWRDKLANLEPLQSLPTDYPRPAVQALQGQLYRHQLDEALSQAIQKQSTQQQVTPFMWLLSSFMLFIGRINQTEEVVVGTPVLGRGHQQLQPLIGLFVNTQVMHADIDGELPFSQWLQKQKVAILEAFEYQDLPFDKLVESLAGTPDLSHHPIVQILFSYDQQTTSVTQFSTFTMSEVSGSKDDLCAVKCDIELYITHSESGLCLNWKFDRNLYLPQTIAHWSACFEQLLKQSTVFPDTKLDRLVLLPEREKQKLLAQPQYREAVWPKQGTILSLFAQQVSQFADREALTDGEHTLTYQQLNARANQLARFLQQQGIKEHSLLAVSLSRNSDLVVTLLAVLKAGAAYVPIDPDYPAERIQYIVDDVASEFLLCDQGSEAAMFGLAKTLVNIEASKPVWSALPEHDLTIQIAPQQLAYMIYTSGTTGRPKGVQIEHRQVVRLLHVDPNYFDFNHTDIWSLFHSFCFDFSVWEMYGALLFGGKLVVVDKATYKDPQAFAQLLVDQQVTVLNQTPSAFYVLQTSLLSLRQSRQDIDSALRYVIFGGEALQPSKLQAFAKHYPSCQLINMYGITETTVHVTFKRLTTQDLALGVSNIGLPIPTTACYILDKHQQLLPQGAVGELYVGGEGVCRGYWQREALNAERFISDPFTSHPSAKLYRSGDLVRALPNGELTYVGRIDDQVKVRGYRIELGEIENQLRLYPALRTATVLLNQNDPDNVRISAFVVLKEECARSGVGEAVRQFLRQNLPEFMLPSNVIAVAEIPLTSNGKVDKKALLALDTIQAEGAHYQAPQGKIEQGLANIFAELLGCERIGRQDSFFSLGGHSLLAAQLVNRVRERYGYALPLRTLFQSPSVQSLAEHLPSLPSQNESFTIHPVDKTSGVPLSFAQQRLWTVEQLTPNAAQYQISAAYQLVGELDLEAFAKAWQAIFTRHEVLRSQLTTDAQGEPKQWLKMCIDNPVSYHDLRLQSDIQQQISWQKLCRDDVQRGFDFSQDDMLRVLVAQTTKHSFNCWINMHHIASDALSLSILVHELSQFYAHFAFAKPLPECLQQKLEIQYADFAVWQRQQLEGQTLIEHQVFWQQHLQDAPPLHQLPLDRPRPKQPNSKALVYQQPLDLALSQALERQCEVFQVTPFMWLHTVFSLLIGQFSNSQDVVIGTPFSGRPQRQLESLVGFFINVLPIRMQYTPEQSFTSLLTQQKQRILDVHQHQSMPFEQIVELQQLPRELSHHGIFQITFALNPQVDMVPQLAGLSVIAQNEQPQQVKFDLELSCTQSASGLRFNWTYASALFDGKTVETLAESFIYLVEQVLASPDIAIAELALQPPAQEQHAKLQGYVDTSYYQHTVLERFEQALPHLADESGLFEANTNQALNYGALQEQASLLARYLVYKGVKPEQPVMVAMSGGIDFIVSILAVLKAGACYVPLSPDYPKARLNYIVGDCQGDVLLMNDHSAAKINALALAQCHVLNINHLALSPAQIPLQIELPQVSPQQLAYVIYTSGTTGNPKGVMITHAGLANLCAWHQRCFAVNQHSVASQTANIAFDAASWEIWPYLSAGASLVCIDKTILNSAKALSETLSAYQVSHCFLATPIAEALLQDAAFVPTTLDYLLVGGDKLNAIDVTQRPFKVINNYGPTETSVVATSGMVDSQISGIEAPDIGVPIDNTCLHILDPNGKPVPAGVVGELYISGVGLARGYLHRPALTQERFVTLTLGENEQRRAYKTGDLVRLKHTGKLAYVGRNDSQVKLRGYRIELDEIITQLQHLPEVKECSVEIVSREVETAKQLIGFVVGEQSQPQLTSSQLQHIQHQLKQVLPEYMIPSELIALESLPLTAHGKVDHRTLQRIAQQQNQPPLAAEQQGDPVTSLQSRLLKIYRQVLKVPSLSVRDDFFSQGGDSILSIQIAGRAKQQNIDLTVAEVFSYPSVEQLAQYLEETQAIVAVESRQPLQGKLLPLPIQQWFFEQPLAQPQHWDQAVLVAVDKQLSWQQLQQVITALLAQHDALRMVVNHEQELQVLSEVQSEAVCHFEILRDYAEYWQSAMAKACDKFHASFAFDNSPLFKVVLFETPVQERANRLLLTAHHLLVDGVSWRIILADLEQLISASLSQQITQLPAKSADLAAIAARFETLAKYADYRHWQEIALLASHRNMFSHIDDPAPSESAPIISHTLRLPHGLTQNLLSEANHSYQTNIQTLLLAALQWCALQHYDTRSQVVMLEGHGREQLSGKVASDRTIGWLTAMYPVPLFSNADSIHDVIYSVKEQLAKLSPQASLYGAIRYLHPQQSVRESLAIDTSHQLFFNYLGQLDTVINDSGVLQDADESIGALISEQNLPHYAAQLTAAVVSGQLQIRFEAATSVMGQARAQRFMQQYQRCIEGISEHCLAMRAQYYTPSDFPLLESVSNQQLQQLVEQYTEQQIEDIYPLSMLQQGMWFHSQQQSSTAYLEQASFLFNQEFDCEAFIYAWQQVMSQHSILRTAFNAILSVPVQLAMKHCDLPLEIDAPAAVISGSESEYLRQLAEQEYRHGVELTTAPGMRLRIIPFKSGFFGVVWTYHHLLMDGWSTPVLFSELRRHYQARIEGRSVYYVTDNYRDYIELLVTRSDIQERAFWQSQLAGIDTPTLLCEQISHATVAANSGSTVQEVSRILPDSLLLSLEQLAKQQGLTLNHIIQAAWAYWISNVCEQDYALFGQTIAGRPRELDRVESRVGLYINTQAVAVSINQEIHVLDFLKQVKYQLSALSDYPHTPLTVAHSLSGVDNGTTLFDALYVFENYPTDPLSAGEDGGLKPSYAAYRDETHYPISLIVGTGKQLSLTISYQSALFSDSTVEQVLSSLLLLLQQFTQQPLLPLTKLRLQPSLQNLDNQLTIDTVSLNKAPASQHPFTGSLSQCFENIAQQYAGQCAVKYYSSLDGSVTELSYQQLNQQANQLARYLIEYLDKKAPEQAIIAVCLPPGIELVVTTLAVLKAGAAYLPIAPALPEQRKNYMLENAQADLLVVWQQDWQTALSSQRVVCVSKCAAEVAQQPTENLDSPSVESDLAYVIYTSGTTGQPKGVMVEQRSVLNYIAFISQQYQISESDNYLQFSSFSFDVFAEELFACLLNGATLISAPTSELLDPNKLAQLSREADISLMSLPTAFWHQLAVTHLELGKKLRFITIGGEAMQVKALQAWQQHYGKQIRLINAYGPTETTISVTLKEVTHHQGNQITIGQPIAGVALHILDKQLRPVADYQSGELYVSGIGLARGYLADEVKTQQAFITHPDTGVRLYKTGDRVRLDKHGEVVFLGRVDEQVKVRGYRIELAEIEQQLLNQTSVLGCAIIVKQDQAGVAQLIAFVEGGSCKPEQLAKALADVLPNYMVPHFIEVVDALPLTTNGKVDRKQLSQLAETMFKAKGGSASALTTITQQLIAKQFEQLLGVESLGAESDFFALGGHSLSAIRLVGEINAQLNLNLPLELVFKQPTIGALAAELERLQQRQESAADNTLNTLVCLQQGEAGYTPIVLVAGAGGLLMAYQSLLYHIDKRIPVYGLQPDEIALEHAVVTSLENTAAWYVDALSTIGTHVHLVGHSFGSFIAYEMAIQLQAKQSPPSSITILDTPLPTVSARKFTNEQIAQYVLQNLTEFFQLKPRQNEISDYIRLTESERMSWLANYLRQAGYLFSEQQLTRFQCVFKAQLEADVEFKIPVDGIPLTVIKANHTTEFEGRPVSADMGWTSLNQHVTCVEIAGEHLTILQSGQVEQVAEQLQRHYVLH
ncbi:amino acid adenylation domain-containing protein [Pseudoalteromonas sp. T1lg65]|uniref:amino acid adenylation domain-containing protein n=1 Tax=Pseudoalteromonas sp. T1lg65 TaxID=2077101 RepID=UPI003F7B065A